MVDDERGPATNVEIVFVDWLDAIRRGDLDRLARRLGPGVVHQGVRPELVCPDRDAVVANAARAAAALPAVDAVELIGVGDHVILSVRAPHFGEPAVAGDPRRGRATIVFTIRESVIVHIQDYLSRDEALAACAAQEHDRWA